MTAGNFDTVHLVGSGAFGFGLSCSHDSSPDSGRTSMIRSINIAFNEWFIEADTI